MTLRHVVLTSVDRDDQPDGGAHIFANTIREIRARTPGCTIEVLIPDFKGDREALKLVMDAHPEILNHNTETVPRLSRWVRPQARHERSLAVLRMAKEMDPRALTKSGVMVGLGEEWDEVLAGDGRSAPCRCRHPDDRPVPAAHQTASAHRALLSPGRVHAPGRRRLRTRLQVGRVRPARALVVSCGRAGKRIDLESEDRCKS